MTWIANSTDLSLAWKDGTIQRGEITVPKSKIAAGTGCVIPLSRRVCACLSIWLERFPEAGPDSFLFLYHKIGLAGNSRLPVLYDVDLDRPMGSCRRAWRIGSKAASVRRPPHDMRHTFISRLAENPNVSEQRLRPSQSMSAARYSKAIATSARRQSKRRFRLSNSPISSQLCGRQGTKMGTLPQRSAQANKLTH
jgi:integrase